MTKELKEKRSYRPRRKLLTTVEETMLLGNGLSKDVSDILSGDRPLSHSEARLLVDLYYMMQKNRVASNNQFISMEKEGEPTTMIRWFMDSFEFLEKQIKKILELYVMSNPNGRWLMSHRGIGPVTSAGLLAHIDIEKAKTAGAIWRFAGLDPTSVWKPKTKRPWNAALKRLCWIIGESFVKFPPSLYNELYAERKRMEIEKNEAGVHKELAAQEMTRVSKATEAYKAYSNGKLPDGRIHLRAQRYAVKIFLAHFHEQLWREKYKTLPPNPYVLEHMGHVHKIESPVPFTVTI